MRLHRSSARFGALALVTALALVGCGGGDESRPTLSGPRSTATTAPAPGTSEIAQVSVPNIEVFSEPDGATPTQSFENPWHVNNDPALGVPLVFLVEDQADDWVKVLLPIRPNGSTGWVRADDVAIASVPYRVHVQLGAHKLTVYKNDEVMLEESVAVGASDTPTPPGKYFLRVLIKAPDPTTVYGPYAYGLSGHSDVLQEFNGGDAELGIHGNNDASVLGKSVTHGCVRMSNDGISRLTSILPLGTPVEIDA